MLRPQDLPEECQQLPGESDKSYSAFLVFVELGSNKRSLPEAYRTKCGRKSVKQAPGYWTTWCKKFKWRERAARFDRYERDLRFQRRQERIAKIQDMAWEASEILFEKAKEMSQFPIARKRQEVENGKQIVIIEPAKWGFRDMSPMFDMAIALAKAATGTGQMDEHEAFRILASLGYVPEHTQRLAVEEMDELSRKILKSIANPPAIEAEAEEVDVADDSGDTEEE